MLTQDRERDALIKSVVEAFFRNRDGNESARYLPLDSETVQAIDMLVGQKGHDPDTAGAITLKMENLLETQSNRAVRKLIVGIAASAGARGYAVNSTGTGAGSEYVSLVTLQQKLGDIWIRFLHADAQTSFNDKTAEVLDVFAAHPSRVLQHQARQTYSSLLKSIPGRQP